MDIEKKILSVSELNYQIKQVLESSYASIWLSGEISNFKAHSSGHYYFSLKDEKSQLSAVMFKGSNRLLKFKLEEGLEVVALGRVTVYEPRGNYQIVVEHLEPKGLGALQLAFEQLKKKLQLMGLFDASRKKPIPVLPKKVGIITSPTGAAIKDILQILKRRFENIEVLLIPVQVQGDKAAPEIAAAIAEMNTFSDVEVMIVGRGGGSLEDLWAFNTEEVALAISASRIPIISAVGHEIDITLSDYVADLRAATPSAAAELVVAAKADWMNTCEQLSQYLTAAMLNLLRKKEEELRYLKSHLKHPRQKIEESMQRVDELSNRLQLALKNNLQFKNQRYLNLAQALKNLSPFEVLKRGYSIVYAKKDLKTPLSSGEGLKKGDVLQLQLSEGKIDAVVSS